MNGGDQPMCRLGLFAAAALLLSGCSAALDNNTSFFPKSSELLAKPDWGVFSGAKTTAARVVSAEDLIAADGSCGAAAPPQPQPVAAAPAPVTPEGATATTGTAAGEAAPTMSGGIGLGMTECEVAQRAGAPERVDLGADEHGERSVVLTYMQGDRAGIYRFRAGRLASIERVTPPEPEKPKKPVRGAKPMAARTSQAY